MFNLSNKEILITGATGYLGSAMVRALCRQGATVYVNSRCEKKASLLVNEMIAQGFKAKPAVFNVNSEASINDWLAVERLTKLNAVINNAYSGASGTIETSQEHEFRDSFEVTVIAAQRLFTKLLPVFRSTVKSGELVSIVNVCSMYGFVSPDISLYDMKSVANPPFYGASKAALHQWSVYGACEFSSEGIRFNSLSPGPFPNKDVQKNAPDFIAKLSNKVPMKRIGQSQEICGPIVFLVADESSFVNGTNLEVNGGWTSW